MQPILAKSNFQFDSITYNGLLAVSKDHIKVLLGNNFILFRLARRVTWFLESEWRKARYNLFLLDLAIVVPSHQQG